MSATASAEDLRSISELLTEFCWRADHDEGAAMADLFTDDAWIDTPHFNVRGRAEIDALFAARSGTKLSRHNWSNLRVTPLGGGRFKTVSNMITAVGSLPAPQRWGRIAFTTSTDEIVRTGDQLLFASRRLQIVFELTVPEPEAMA